MTDREKLKNFIWHGLPVCALVVWGLLCLTDYLWYDEAYSAALVALPWRRLIYITAVDAHSPFYYSLLKLLYLLCGGGTHFFVLKLLSLFFMMGYMLLGKYYVRKLFDRETSLYFMLFSLLMPIMSVQAGNVRMYAAALFFMTLMGLSAYDIYKEETPLKWAVFCLASICTVYCHTFAMIQAFLFYVLFLAALLIGGQKEKRKGFFVCGGIVALAFSPWLYVTARQMLLRMRYDTGSVQERASLASFADYTREWFSALETPIDGVAYLGLALFFVLVGLGLCGLGRQADKRPLIGLGALLLTILTGFLISVFVNNCFLGRYAFPGFGFLMLFYALGMKQIRRIPPRVGIWGAALLCFGLQYGSELSLEYEDEGLKAYRQFIEEEVEAEDVMIGPYAHTVFLSVYHPGLKVYIDGYKPYKLPFDNVEELTNHEALEEVSGDIWYICFAGDIPWSFREEYDYREALAFHYMYYDFVIYRLERSNR
ncbi:MAG: hypothetical protein NC081_01380 [Roseburia sp.]|nr:hypothetical protein [Roseburia sp.]